MYPNYLKFYLTHIIVRLIRKIVTVYSRRGHFRGSVDRKSVVRLGSPLRISYATRVSRCPFSERNVIAVACVVCTYSAVWCVLIITTKPTHSRAYQFEYPNHRLFLFLSRVDSCSRPPFLYGNTSVRVVSAKSFS